MKKLSIFVSLLVTLSLLLTACATSVKNTPSAKTDIRVVTIQGPTGIGMVGLMDAQDAGTSGNNYTFSVASSAEEVGPKLSNGDVDIAAIPTNMAAALYNKTNGNVRLLAVNTLGVLYLLENGDTVHSVADLKGKTVYSTGEGANPQYILEYLLRNNGLEPDRDVTVTYLTENTELAALMVSNKAAIALVPQPVVTSILTQNNSIRLALSMNDAWNATAGADSKLMMGCVAVRKEFLESNPEAVKTFLTEYETSINGVNADPKSASVLCEKYGIVAKATLAEKAIPKCNITFIKGDSMKAQISGYYQVLYAANPASVGGKLPDDSFYYLG